MAKRAGNFEFSGLNDSGAVLSQEKLWFGLEEYKVLSGLVQIELNDLEHNFKPWNKERGAVNIRTAVMLWSALWSIFGCGLCYYTEIVKDDIAQPANRILATVTRTPFQPATPTPADLAKFMSHATEIPTAIATLTNEMANNSVDAVGSIIIGGLLAIIVGVLVLASSDRR